ncbi:MAG: DNA repair protein RecO [Treponema sp.]|nr:DNA repair protein RecO [Treponema sp.]
MAERNKKMRALILSARRTGECNRLVTVLSAENGIFSAILYGGPKSRLRSLVQPFYAGTLYVYADEARHSVKITDFDAENCHLSLRTSLFKSWAASFACELAVKTKCAGDSERAFVLLSAFLDGTDAVSETEARLGMLRFLWRYLALLGLQPDARFCASCKASLLSHEKDAVFDESQNGFICRDCRSFSPEYPRTQPQQFSMDIDALTYIAAVSELPPGQVRKLLVPPCSAGRIKQLLFYLIEKSCGTRLETLESGAGIL